MMNTASRDPFVHQADAAYDDHIKKQGQAPNYFGWFERYFRNISKINQAGPSTAGYFSKSDLVEIIWNLNKVGLHTHGMEVPF